MVWTKDQVKEIFRQSAIANGIDVNIALAQIAQESGYNANAISWAGAQGAAQFMPGTWATYGKGTPFNPNDAAAAWAKYMRHLLGVFGGRYDLALAGYNGGENRNVLRSALASGRSLFSYPFARAWTRTAVHTESWHYAKKILQASGSALANAVPVVEPPEELNGEPDLSAGGPGAEVVLIAGAGLILLFLMLK